MENEQDLQENREDVVAVVPVDGESIVGNIIPALNSEADLAEKEIFADDADDHKQVDYSTYTKKDFVGLVKELVAETNFKKVDAVLKEIRPLYDDIRERLRAEAMLRFKADNGLEEDFDFKMDETDHAFDATIKLIRDKRNQYYKSLEDRKNESLRGKLELLEKLRAVVDSEDSVHAFTEFKEIQKSWKALGPVPPAQARTLWANYSALVDRFYDHRNIYFELKELDRKKNLEIKLELCARAERLIDFAKINDAVKELNELHHEFKHVGPVPKDDQENVWQRFKTASDTLYKKRDGFVAELHQELLKNLELKEQIAADIAVYGTFQSDRIKEWNQKTQELLEIQKKWDAIGGVPRSRIRDVNKKFWSAFKSFFHNKNVFFKKLDDARSKNLQAKLALVARALELKESTEWDESSEELKELQRKWKEVGPVPEKQREKVYMQFKEACDHFFDQRRTILEKADHEQEENLVKKEAILTEMMKHTVEKTGTLEHLQTLQHRFAAIGFVPKRAIASVRSSYAEATNSFMASIQNLSPEEKSKATLEIQISNLRNDPQGERKIFQKEVSIRKQITKAENDIAVLRNNLEFFGRSKNAEKFKAEFNEKIKEASVSIQELKNQLKLLKTS